MRKTFLFVMAAFSITQIGRTTTDVNAQVTCSCTCRNGTCTGNCDSEACRQTRADLQDISARAAAFHSESPVDLKARAGGGETSRPTTKSIAEFKELDAASMKPATGSIAEFKELDAASMKQGTANVQGDTGTGTPGETAKAKRDQILGLSASKASTLNKVAAIGGAATGVTSTITSGVGAFATDFSSMKSRIDACLNSLNISQN